MTQDQTPDRPDRRAEPAEGETERLDGTPDAATERLDDEPTRVVGPVEGSTRSFEPPYGDEPTRAEQELAPEPGTDGLAETEGVSAATEQPAAGSPGWSGPPGAGFEPGPGAGGAGFEPGAGPGAAPGWTPSSPPGAAGGAGWMPPGPPGAPPGGGPGGPPPGTAAAGRRWRRSKRSRVVAGVAGGLGEYTGVDPVLFRVLFAVLALPVFGWVGLLLYLVAWLILPDGEDETSLAEAVVGRGRDGKGRDLTHSVEGLVLAVLASLLLVLLVRGDLSDGGDVALVGLLGIGGWLILRRRDRRGWQRGPGAPPVPPGEATYAAAPAGVAAPTAGAPPYAAPGPYAGPGPYARPTGPLPYERSPAPPPAPKERSVLGRLAVSAAVLVCGVIGLLDATGAIDPQPRQYLAAAVGTLGLALIVGAVYGRARWLAWLAFPLTIAMIVAGVAQAAVKGGTGDFNYTPTTVAGVQSRYEFGVGSLMLDMSTVDFRNQSVAIRIRGNLGDVKITVPANVDVTVTAHVGLGDVRLFGSADDGVSLTRTVTDTGADGTGGGTLAIDADMGVGDVEVDR
jgi:phage shock protein PspC (stress-responsive transcriptional regulator)